MSNHSPIMSPTVQRTTPASTVSFEDTSIAFGTRSTGQLRKTYWLFALMNQAGLVNVGTFFIKIALKLQLPIKNLIRHTIFEQFCGGESIRDCEATIQQLARAHVGTILDYSVEGEENEVSFERTVAETLLTIDRAAGALEVPFSVFKMSGIAPTDLLEAVQRNETLSDEQQGSFARVQQRLDILCRRAAERGVRLFIDAEESWIQDAIDQLAYQMMDRYNHEQPIVYNTYQLYRWETLPNLTRAEAEARRHGYLLGAKLVRGAYLEKERVRAHEGEYQDPIQPSKEATDRDFSRAIDFCLNHRDVISICLGTHNDYSCQYCLEQMSKLGIAANDPHVWFAQLLGMSDNISYNLAHAGYNVAKYVPYGPVAAVMPYLFRRADENKSIAGQSSREFSLVQRELARRQKC